MHTPGTSHPRRWWILGALCLSVLVLVIDNTVLNLAIPALMRELDAGTADIQWIISAYTLAYAGLLLTAGGLSDRFGRKRLLIIGLVVFGVASIAAALATGPAQLIAGRALMGVGGSLVMPSTMSILITVFDEGERRTAIAAWSAVSLAGILAGPSLGGLLLDHFWWGSVFLINVPVAAIAIIAAAAMMPESTGPAVRPDVLGALLCTLGMIAVVWSIIAAPQRGWGSVGTGGALAAGITLLVAFVIWELRSPHPMLPLRVFGDRNFCGGTFSVMLLAFAAAGMILALTQYVQLVLGYGVLQAGMALLPFAGSSALFNIVGATLAKKVSTRAMVSVGMLITAGGFLVLWSITPGDGYPVLATALAAMGMGAGLAAPAAVTALMAAIPPAHAGAGSAMNSTLSQAGSALGIATLGSVLATAYTAAMPPGLPATARQSLAGAMALGDGNIATVARAAFVEAMSFGMVTGATLATVAAVLAFILLRTRSRPADPAATPVAAELTR
ncbi:MFS transporter [Nonomuraea turcica]|uniref:MFS transporter n=1 Tax=Nonomuraea sp. G32 TaxID=3067274 RepID=UPI00273AD1DE|nr:MFS transporter [Nonomuraea sp. G32]MDP4510560.1 MFS transporter [Nonomuraea sp. G32]